MFQNRLFALASMLPLPATGLGDFVEGNSLHTSRTGDFMEGCTLQTAHKRVTFV